MSDIFISYSKSDRETARVLAEALEKKGWSVWWDRKIPPGKSFDQIIEEALNETKCVIVLWSKESINSNWVKEEASEGLKRNILVPALIDEVAIPLGFKRLQAANLVDWSGTSQHTEFDEMVGSIRGILGEPKRHEPQKGTEPKQQVETSQRTVEIPPEPKIKSDERKYQDGHITIASQIDDSGISLDRIKGAVVWGVLGFVYVGFLFATGSSRDIPGDFMSVSILNGIIPGMITGAIMGVNFRILPWVILGILVASTIFLITFQIQRTLLGVAGMFGWAYGTISGALLGLIVQKLKK